MEYAYQWSPEHLLSYPNFYDDPSSRARDFVMVSCLNVTAGGGTCENSRDGGRFQGAASVSLTVAPVVGAEAGTISYTLDGSNPAQAGAKKYGGKALEVAAATTVRAVVVRGGVAATQQRNTTFVKAG